MIVKSQKLRKLEDEEWLEVPESNKQYMVSNYGRIKSYVIDKVNGLIMKCSIINSYRFVQLKINGKPRRVYVHKLVAEVWLPQPSELHSHVVHLDRNLKNNHVSNLQWATKETCYERNAEYLSQKYSDPNRPKIITQSKLKEQDIVHLKSMLNRGVPNSRIAKMFCISETQVSRIKKGENWNHVKV
jgi:hypothetical protein